VTEEEVPVTYEPPAEDAVCACSAMPGQHRHRRMRDWKDEPLELEGSYVRFGDQE
jgi:hypothetical protein